MACRAWASMAGLTIVCEMLGVPHEHNRILTPELHLNARGTCGAAQSKCVPAEFRAEGGYDVHVRK